MKLLADESIDRQIVERLRQDGHDVTYVVEKLLTPFGEPESEHDVHLIIHVKTLVSGSDGLAAFLA